MRLVAAVPGDEARCSPPTRDVGGAAQPGALLIVGERLATVPGGLSAAAALAAAYRRAAGLGAAARGDRGAVDAGCLPNLLPGGRPVADAAARAELAAAWGRVRGMPSQAGRDTDGIIAAAADGSSAAWWSAAWTRPTWPTRDWPRPRWTRCRSWSAWSCGQRGDPAGQRGAADRAGRREGRKFLDWEGRLRPFERC